MSDSDADGRAPDVLGVDLERVASLFEAGRGPLRSHASPFGGSLLRGLQSFLYGAPMHWMQQWPGSYPVYVAEAKGAHVTDVDGHTYVDFALGDTGPCSAMPTP